MDDDDRLGWARALTTVGWLLVFAYVARLTAQIRQAFAITESQFDDGVFGARVERLSFMVFPENVLMLTVAAGAAALATVLARGVADRRHIWLAQLVRVAAGVCYIVIAIATVRIMLILTHDPDGVGDFSATVQQVGGILVASATIRVSLEAERRA